VRTYCTVTVFGHRGGRHLPARIALRHFVLGNAFLEGGLLLSEADLLGELTARQFLLPAIKELSAVAGRPVALRHEARGSPVGQPHWPPRS